MPSNFLVVQSGRCELRFLEWGKVRWSGFGGWKLYAPSEQMSLRYQTSKCRCHTAFVYESLKPKEKSGWTYVLELSVDEWYLKPWRWMSSSKEDVGNKEGNARTELLRNTYLWKTAKWWWRRGQRGLGGGGLLLMLPNDPLNQYNLMQADSYFP